MEDSSDGAARDGALTQPSPTSPRDPTAHSMRQALEDRDATLADFKGREAAMQKKQDADVAPLAARCASMAKAIGDIHAVLHGAETSRSDLGCHAGVGDGEGGSGGGTGFEGHGRDGLGDGRKGGGGDGGGEGIQRSHAKMANGRETEEAGKETEEKAEKGAAMEADAEKEAGMEAERGADTEADSEVVVGADHVALQFGEAQDSAHAEAEEESLVLAASACRKARELKRELQQEQQNVLAKQRALVSAEAQHAERTREVDALKHVVEKVSLKPCEDLALPSMACKLPDRLQYRPLLTLV